MSSAPVLERSGRDAGPTDHQLVSAVRRGDDRAFEALYTRYQRRIAAYVFGMVKDYGRAEDITQEVFVSALRRMRQTERPIAFKPWVYEIAKNACIDAYRRQRRTEEVSFEADDRLSAADHGRLVATAPEPEAAVDAKQEIDLLCGAFGGLAESHHQILVMRELEGRSYKDIGERMGMSRPAVESTLFRARKRLGEEYDELASGARCLRIQSIIVEAGEARLGLRDQRRLARHVSHCQPCRRLAAQSGLDIPVPARTRVAGKLAAWLPLPGFLRLRRGGGDDVTAPATGGGGGHAGWLAHVPAFSDSMSTGWGKAAAGLAALVVAGAGAGVTTQLAGDKRDERGTGYRPAAERTVERDGTGGAVERTPAAASRAADAGPRRSSGRVRGPGRDRGDAGGSASLGGNGGNGGGERSTAPRTAPGAAGGDATPERPVRRRRRRRGRPQRGGLRRAARAADQGAAGGRPRPGGGRRRRPGRAERRAERAAGRRSGRPEREPGRHRSRQRGPERHQDCRGRRPGRRRRGRRRGQRRLRDGRRTARPLIRPRLREAANMARTGRGAAW